MKRYLILLLLICFCGGNEIVEESKTTTSVPETTTTTKELVIWDEIITSNFQKIFADDETISLFNKYFDIYTVDKSSIYQESYFEANSTTLDECIDYQMEYISEKDNELTKEEVRSSAQEICSRVENIETKRHFLIHR